jgi:hypothetical protein
LWSLLLRDFSWEPQVFAFFVFFVFLFELLLTNLNLSNTTPGTRWETKVFAVQCVRKIIAECIGVAPYETNPHFHLAEARKASGDDYLVLQLSEVIRTSYASPSLIIDFLLPFC